MFTVVISDRTRVNCQKLNMGNSFKQRKTTTFFFFLRWVLDTETVAKKGCWITILCNIQNLMAYSPGWPALGDLQRSLQTSALLCYGYLGRSWTYINSDHNYIFKWRQWIFKYLPRILINSTAAKLLHRKLNVFTKSELNSNIDNF